MIAGVEHEDIGDTQDSSLQTVATSFAAFHSSEAGRLEAE